LDLLKTKTALDEFDLSMKSNFAVEETIKAVARERDEV